MPESFKNFNRHGITDYLPLDEILDFSSVPESHLNAFLTGERSLPPYGDDGYFIPIEQSQEPYRLYDGNQLLSFDTQLHVISPHHIMCPLIIGLGYNANGSKAFFLRHTFPGDTNCRKLPIICLMHFPKVIWRQCLLSIRSLITMINQMKIIPGL